jgi:hypothetical protein
MYQLYMVCLNCGCTDLYSYKKKHGVLLSMWKDSNAVPRAGPTVCDHCHDDFPDIDPMCYRMDVLTDVTEKSFQSSVASNAYIKVACTSSLVPQPALVHDGHVLPLSADMLPDLVGAHGTVTKDVNRCSGHQ